MSDNPSHLKTICKKTTEFLLTDLGLVIILNMFNLIAMPGQQKSYDFISTLNDMPVTSKSR